MNTIIDACNDIMSVVNDNRTKQEVLEDCAKEKMIKIFDQENAEFEDAGFSYERC